MTWGVKGKWGAAFAVVLAVPVPAEAATYYVSPGGNDRASGSRAAPWRTVGRVSRARFAPGDVVRFAGRGVWHETLEPRSRGARGRPVVFTTYGHGRAVLDGAGARGFAGIVVQAPFEVFDRLEVRAWRGHREAVYLTDRVHDVAFTRVYVHDVDEGVHPDMAAPPTGIGFSHSRFTGIGTAAGGSAFNIPPHASRFVVTTTSISRVADSCVIDRGTGNVYRRLRVSRCGWASLGFARHGLYLRGPRNTVLDSSVHGVPNDCVSIRAQGDVAQGNRLWGCGVGVGFFDDSSGSGRAVVRRNVIWGVRTAVYVDGSPRISFAIANNTIFGSGPRADGIMIATTGGRVPVLQIANNIVAGVRIALSVQGAGSFFERANFLSSTARVPFRYGPRVFGTIGGFESAAGVGPSVARSPGISGPPYARPARHAPVIDAGIANPGGGLLTPGCDGASSHYCGRAPDVGAVEYVPRRG